MKTGDKMFNIKGDIIVLEQYLNLIDTLGSDHTNLHESIKNILSDHKRISKENEELKSRMKADIVEVRDGTIQMYIDSKMELESKITDLEKQNEESKKQNEEFKKQIDEKIAKAKKDLEKTNKRIKKSKTREEETVLWTLIIRLDEKIKLLEELREDMKFWR